MKLQFKYRQGIVMESSYHRLYRDDKNHCQCEVFTKRKDGMPIGNGEVTFYLDGIDAEFRSEDAMKEFMKSCTFNKKTKKWVQLKVNRDAP
jgi:hypothetical protein